MEMQWDEKHAAAPAAFTTTTSSSSSVACVPVCSEARVYTVLDAQTQNGDEPVGEYSFLGQSCLSSADSC